MAEEEAVDIPPAEPVEPVASESLGPALDAATANASPSTSGRPTRRRAADDQDDDADRTEPDSKRPRRDAEARSRGRRMFGLVTSTLKKVANENEKLTTGEAAKRRAEIEERLKSKLQRETEQLNARASQAQHERADLAELQRITNAIVLGETDFRVRKAQKRRLASFLCAKVDISGSTIGRRGSSTQPLSTSDYATDLPFGLGPLQEGAPCPKYHLPTKLLASQEDELDEQEDRVDRLIDDAETEWRERRSKLEQRGKELRELIMNRRAKVAALEEASKDQKLEQKASETVRADQQGRDDKDDDDVPMHESDGNGSVHARGVPT